ncbi:hypothetical protein E4U17_004914 [Claviceps sp. LM77 group G4]|nr:hypothetical protein E4U17_004914 [Claviceps sp. LM77 group G4]KAG6068361.1 hypothetical protein E4U33_005083 [Claviceps sp. LM78 group G4]KAG6072485.1 hypothetical protein E4U16_005304 [Claviceps sp. LM84 group G4]
MRIGSSARILAGSLVLAAALETQPALLRIDQENFPDEIYKPECDVCCPTVFRTVLSTIYTTIIMDGRQYVTETEHDVTTKLETQFVTTTATITYASSYPVTVTKSIGCDGHIYGRSTPSDGEEDEAEMQQLEGRTHHGCRTTTVTDWVTTTATQLVTGIELVTRTQTLPVTVTVPEPTTICDATTIVGSTTIWVPTTYVRNTTIISEHPVTRTVDNTIHVTKSTTVYTTIVSTVATSYPVVSYITESLTKTVTAPGASTIALKPTASRTTSDQGDTFPAQTGTEQPVSTALPSTQSITVTRPSAQSQAVIGSTLVSSLTTTQSASTDEVTRSQTSKTVVEPNATVTESLTQTLPLSLITEPAKTITETPIYNVTLCPTPTGSTAPLSPTSDLTFGCKPGYVCNPPKPDGCNLWPGPPADDFLCDKKDCIPAPPLHKPTGGDGDYYPPSYGYFNLDPEPFGLSYNIFAKPRQFVKDVHNTKDTSSQQTPPVWHKVSHSASDSYPTSSPTSSRQEKKASESRKRGNKRDTVSDNCYKESNQAYDSALALGKTPALCAEDSIFERGFDLYERCVKANSQTTMSKMARFRLIRIYVEHKFDQFLDYCDDLKSGTLTKVPDQLQSMVSQKPSVATSLQADTSKSGWFTPVVPTSTSTQQPVPHSATPSLRSVTTISYPSSSSTSSSSSSSTMTSKLVRASSSERIPLPSSPAGDAENPTSPTKGVAFQASTSTGRSSEKSQATGAPIAEPKIIDNKSTSSQDGGHKDRPSTRQSSETAQATGIGSSTEPEHAKPNTNMPSDGRLKVGPATGQSSEKAQPTSSSPSAYPENGVANPTPSQGRAYNANTAVQSSDKSQATGDAPNAKQYDSDGQPTTSHEGAASAPATQSTTQSANAGSQPHDADSSITTSPSIPADETPVPDPVAHVTAAASRFQAPGTLARLAVCATVATLVFTLL